MCLDVTRVPLPEPHRAHRREVRACVALAQSLHSLNKEEAADVVEEAGRQRHSHEHTDGCIRLYTIL